MGWAGLGWESEFSLYLPSNTFEAVFVKMLALIDIILDTIADGLVAEKASRRVIAVAAFALKRPIGFGEETLTG